MCIYILYVLILEFILINLQFALSTILSIFLKIIKFFIDLKYKINLTNSITKFINNKLKLKPKQYPKTNYTRHKQKIK